MSKFDALYNNLVEAVPVTPSVGGAQPTPNQPNVNPQQPVAKPATPPVTSTTAAKIDVNNPIIKELIAANDPTKVITALQKLGIQ
jgi:hypothetical protein